MLGGFDPKAFENTPVESFALFLSVAFMLIVSIILLNLLIAIMGNSYSKVQVRVVQQYRWEQANSILDQWALKFCVRAWCNSDTANTAPTAPTAPTACLKKHRYNPEQVHFLLRSSASADERADLSGKDLQAVETAEWKVRVEGRVQEVHHSTALMNDEIYEMKQKIDLLVEELVKNKKKDQADLSGGGLRRGGTGTTNR
jgi:hypothetical protein